MDTQVLPLVSIVTPVYNGERYLEECIESVRDQTYSNWEYVIVDNRSTDRTHEIAVEYARRDSRIRIHSNTEFLPVIANWNHALRQISPDSKYCKVVHADDCLLPGCLSEMVALAEAHPSVGIVGAYSLYGTRVKLGGLPYPTTVFPGREICRSALLDGLRIFGSPTALLIRSDIVRERDALYDEAELHADVAACFEILRDRDFGFVHQVLTYTRVHDESITNSLSKPLYIGRLSKLTTLKRYGPAYLSPDEYQRLFSKQIDDYYKFLGKHAFRRRSRKLREYHLTGLRDAGEPLRLKKLAWSWLVQRGYSVLNPGAIVREHLTSYRSLASPNQS